MLKTSNLKDTDNVKFGREKIPEIRKFGKTKERINWEEKSEKNDKK